MRQYLTQGEAFDFAFDKLLLSTLL